MRPNTPKSPKSPKSPTGKHRFPRFTRRGSDAGVKKPTSVAQRQVGNNSVGRRTSEGTPPLPGEKLLTQSHKRLSINLSDLNSDVDGDDSSDTEQQSSLRSSSTNFYLEPTSTTSSTDTQESDKHSKDKGAKSPLKKIKGKSKVLSQSVKGININLLKKPPHSNSSSIDPLSSSTESNKSENESQSETPREKFFTFFPKEIDYDLQRKVDTLVPMYEETITALASENTIQYLKHMATLSETIFSILYNAYYEKAIQEQSDLGNKKILKQFLFFCLNKLEEEKLITRKDNQANTFGLLYNSCSEEMKNDARAKIDKEKCLENFLGQYSELCGSFLRKITDRYQETKNSQSYKNINVNQIKFHQKIYTFIQKIRTNLADEISIKGIMITPPDMPKFYELSQYDIITPVLRNFLPQELNTKVKRDYTDDQNKGKRILTCYEETLVKQSIRCSVLIRETKKDSLSQTKDFAVLKLGRIKTRFEEDNKKFKSFFHSSSKDKIDRISQLINEINEMKTDNISDIGDIMEKIHQTSNSDIIKAHRNSIFSSALTLFGKSTQTEIELNTIQQEITDFVLTPANHIQAEQLKRIAKSCCKRHGYDSPATSPREHGQGEGTYLTLRS